MIEKQRPLFLIVSPMCTAFSGWQHINDAKRPADIVQREKEIGRLHLDWCMKLCARQMELGGYFLHEHPDQATSWAVPSVRALMAKKGVARVTGDQCQMGQETDDHEPIKKPTGFLSNAPEVLKLLAKRCRGSGGYCSRPRAGIHRLCNGKVARRAAIYSQRMCELIIRGIRDQMIVDGTYVVGEAGPCVQMYDGFDEVNLCRLGTDNECAESTAKTNPVGGSSMPGTVPPSGKPEPWSKPCKNNPSSSLQFVDHSFDSILAAASQNERYVDDITGQPLPPELCREARRVEVEYFRSKGVWELCKITEALQKSGRRPITVRWV